MLSSTASISSQQAFITAARPSTAPKSRKIISCTATHRPEESSSRRDALMALTGLAATLALNQPALADEDPERVFCDASCVSDLANKPRTKTASGLEYQDIVVGTGPSAPVGYQVVAHYVAMNKEGKIFANSLERKEGPYDFRVGAGQVVAGLDEGILTMKVGGVRRLYIPGSLAFPKGLSAGPGRPRVAPNDPVVFDVQLLYIPGLEEDE